MNRAGILILALACACSEKSPAAADAPLEIDGDVRPDASLDAEIDAAVDAPVDAPPDAPSASPRCTTMASTLIDVSPRRLGNLVVAGNVLYATVYDLGPSETVINAAVLSIDLTTETQAAAPLSTTAAPFLTTNGTDVYAPDVNQIWRLRNGMAPVTVVTNRPGVLIAIGDATHVY